MENITTGQQLYTISQLRRRIIIRFLVFGLGILFTLGSYCSVTYLQSSINIEAGVGVTSLIATYLTSAVFGLFFTPILFAKCGPKVAVLMSQVCYMIYVAANFYPESYVLIPAGAIAGMGEATMWPAMMIFAAHYARCYARYGSKDSSFYVTEFLGYIFSSFQISQVVGNLISFGIFYAGKSIQPNGNGIDTGSTVKPLSKDLTFCGANDCQDPNITQRNINRYEPASQATLYTTMGVMGGMILSAIFLYVIFLPKIDHSLEVQDNENNKLDTVAQPEGTKETLKRILEIVKKTFLQLIDVRQLLITPFTIYTGMLAAYVFSELTRAFASCMIGVDQVGLCTAIFAASGAISAFATGKLSSRFGRNLLIAAGLIADIGGYMIALFWIPNETNLWVVYALFVLGGIADGIWEPLLLEIHSKSFPNTEEIAFVVWNLWGVVGLTIQFAWSTSVCVRDKIYIQLGLLGFSIILYYVDELAYKSKNKVPEEKSFQGTYL